MVWTISTRLAPCVRKSLDPCSFKIMILNRVTGVRGHQLRSAGATAQRSFKSAHGSRKTTSLGGKRALGCTGTARAARHPTPVVKAAPSGVSRRAASVDRLRHDARQPMPGQVTCRTAAAASSLLLHLDVHPRMVMQIQQHAQGRSRPAGRCVGLLGGDPARPLMVGSGGLCCTFQLYRARPSMTARDQSVSP
jgi:hypothetical protein